MNNYSMDTIKQLIGITLTGKPIDNMWLENRMKEQSPVSNGSFHLYYRLFYRIANELCPDFTVELGGWRGLAAGCFAGGCSTNQVVTIDHHGDPGDDLHQIAMREVESHFYNMKYIQGWTWDVIGQVRAMDKKIDVLFVDGWHVYDKAKKDWDYYSPLLADGALVICDDLLRGDSATIAGMQRFWDEVSGDFDKHVEDSAIHEGYPMGFFRYVK